MELIDQTTGEIIDVDALEAQRNDLFRDTGMKHPAEIQPFLWKLGRACRGIDWAMDPENQHSSIKMVESEIERLTEVRLRMIDALEQRKLQCLMLAQYAMNQTGTEKAKLDGVGTFRNRKLPAKVVETGEKEFAALTQQQQEAYAAEFPEVIKYKITYSPDKKAIKSAIEEGHRLPGFAIEEGGTKFEFAKE